LRDERDTVSATNRALQTLPHVPGHAATGTEYIPPGNFHLN
jgi:hypothetical protein